MLTSAASFAISCDETQTHTHKTKEATEEDAITRASDLEDFMFRILVLSDIDAAATKDFPIAMTGSFGTVSATGNASSFNRYLAAATRLSLASQVNILVLLSKFIVFYNNTK